MELDSRYSPCRLYDNYVFAALHPFISTVSDGANYCFLPLTIAGVSCDALDALPPVFGVVEVDEEVRRRIVGQDFIRFYIILWLFEQ